MSLMYGQEQFLEIETPYFPQVFPGRFLVRIVVMLLRSEFLELRRCCALFHYFTYHEFRQFMYNAWGDEWRAYHYGSMLVAAIVISSSYS